MFLVAKPVMINASVGPAYYEPSVPESEPEMKLSARNVLPGRVKEIHKGQTTSTVKIDIGHGLVVTASITNEAVDDLALKNGDSVSAIIKASEVIVGK